MFASLNERQNRCSDESPLEHDLRVAEPDDDVSHPLQSQIPSSVQLESARSLMPFAPVGFDHESIAEDEVDPPNTIDLHLASDADPE